MTQTKLQGTTKQTCASMPHGVQGLPNNLPLMKEEVLIKRTISQIKAGRLFDQHRHQSSNNFQKSAVLIYFAAETWNHSILLFILGHDAVSNGTQFRFDVACRLLSSAQFKKRKLRGIKGHYMGKEAKGYWNNRSAEAMGVMQQAKATGGTCRGNKMQDTRSVQDTTEILS